MDKLFTLSNGNVVRIEVDEDSYKTTVFTEPGREEIGSMEFNEIEYDERLPNILKLTWAYLDKLNGVYLHKGIGRECIKFVSEVSGLAITASENDGERKDDGSHLTADAPHFVGKMREEGLIV